MESGDVLTENMDISKLKVSDLRRELKSRGLSTTGNKNDLLEKLQKALKSKMDTVSVECVDDLEEDLLNDDDDEHLDGSESGITDLDSAIDVPTTQKSHKRKSSETSQEAQPKQAKKVVLNRMPSNPESLTQNGVDTEKKSETDVQTKKVIKLSELSAKERLEMRAKKFGVPLPADAKKVVRAERFGTNSPASSKTTTASPVNVDILKQRAERFGGSVSSVMTKLSNQEQLDKRKERFGSTATTTNTATNGSPLSDKAKQRLERFKTPVT